MSHPKSINLSKTVASDIINDGHHIEENYEPKASLISRLIPYIQIARPDHWFKNIFMLPGIAFAAFDSPGSFSWGTVWHILIGLLATCLVASGNYTINEILDADKDRLHPIKKDRPIPSGKINLPIAYLEWILLGAIGLALGWLVNFHFFLCLSLLLFMGFLYNIPPIRLKDLPYLDVISEAVNNPIRLCLGWFILIQSYPPTLSLIMAYWMIGAFFMTTKRFAEYRRIADPAVAAKYRKSFSYYNDYRLLLSMVYYASAFSLFFGIFLIRYRIELILAIPFLAGFIPVYMRLGFWEDSPAQYPERLYKQKGLVCYTAFCLAIIVALLFIDIPIIERLFQPMHIPK